MFFLRFSPNLALIFVIYKYFVREKTASHRCEAARYRVDIDMVAEGGHHLRDLIEREVTHLCEAVADVG